jgi:hypothetical protein
VRGRFAAAIEEIGMVARGATPTHEHLRSRLMVLTVASMALDVVATVAVWLAERHAHGSEIHSLGSSLFWTTSQLLTVSSSMANPVSTLGRVFDVLLEAWAISIVTMLAGSFGAFFHRRGLERDPLKA